MGKQREPFTLSVSPTMYPLFYEFMVNAPRGKRSVKICEVMESNLRWERERTVRMRDLLIDILAEHTGKTKKKVAKDTDRDYFMSADEALEYGIIDRIIPPRG